MSRFSSRIHGWLLPALPVLVAVSVGSCALSSCSLLKGHKRVDDYVARVGDVYLTRTELEEMMPQGLILGDSAETASRKVAAWVQTQVLLQKAKENLDISTNAQVERQIENYRQSLLIFNYEEQITQRLLDTVISDGEVEDYYEQHRNQFVLKSNIVRLRFVKVLKTGKDLDKLRRGLFDKALEEGDALSRLADLCRKSADNYFLDADKWLYFNDVLREVPIKTYNQEDFLKNHCHIELEAGDYIYFVSILEFKVRDMVSPLDFERDRIKTVIMNQRKKAVLDRMEADLMEEALKSGLVDYGYGDGKYGKDSI